MARPVRSLSHPYTATPALDIDAGSQYPLENIQSTRASQHDTFTETDPLRTLLKHTPSRQDVSHNYDTLKGRRSKLGRWCTLPNWLSNWPLELAFAFISLVLIAVIVAILKIFDGKPYQTWRLGNANITPNTLISIVSTLSKAALLLPIAQGLSQLKWNDIRHQPRRLLDIQRFDDASRGSLGAARLLFALRLHNVLASLGALLTILALAVDPLVQQILTYPTRMSPVHNLTATIGASYGLDAPIPIIQSPNSLSINSSDLEGPGTDATRRKSGLKTILSIDGAITDAIINGPSQMPSTCPSGNCTWLTFRSFAACSSCADVTTAIISSCSNGEIAKNGSVIYSCNYTLPHGTVFNVDWATSCSLSLSDNSSTETLQPSLQLKSSTWAFEPNATDTGPDFAGWLSETSEFFNLSSIRLNDTYPNGDCVLQGKSQADTDFVKSFQPSAYECRMDWCETTFASSFQNGAVQEIPQATVKLQGNRTLCDDDDSYRRCPIFPISSPQPPAELTNATRTPKSSNDGVYWLDEGSFTSIQRMLQSSLNVVTRSQSYEFPSAGYNLYLANGGNLTQTMQDVATSLTNQLRQGPNSTIINGEVSMGLTYIQVNWAWLAYLIVLSFLALVFLILVMMSSAGDNKYLWKGSSLAFLFHGFDETPATKRINTLAGMEKAARSTHVQLSEDVDGVGLTVSERLHT